MIYFSFSLYGDNPKYTLGMIANAEILQKQFPDARVAVYVADDVPADIVTRLHAFSNVHIIPVKRSPGTEGSFDRFLTIDISDCDIMFVRDSDSRVHDRDVACIEDFLAAPDKLIHIIRDHFYHTSAIMAGMWAIRKSALIEPMALSIANWKRYNNCTTYFTDQTFLNQIFYKRLLPNAMIHDRIPRLESADKLTPFRVPIVNKLFIGQVHNYDVCGNEYCVCNA